MQDSFDATNESPWNIFFRVDDENIVIKYNAGQEFSHGQIVAEDYSSDISDYLHLTYDHSVTTSEDGYDAFHIGRVSAQENSSLQTILIDDNGKQIKTLPSLVNNLPNLILDQDNENLLSINSFGNEELLWSTFTSNVTSQIYIGNWKTATDFTDINNVMYLNCVKISAEKTTPWNSNDGKHILFDMKIYNPFKNKKIQKFMGQLYY